VTAARRRSPRHEHLRRQAVFDRVASDWDTMRIAYYDERVIDRLGEFADLTHGSECEWARAYDAGSRRRFRATALSATMMLEPAIEMAPTSGRRTKPSGSKTPAATGSARLL
jgi:hypothetical protein